MNYFKLFKKLYRNLTGRSGKVIALHEHKAYIVLIPKAACSSLTAIATDILQIKLPDNSWKPGVFRGSSYDHIIDTKYRDEANLVTRDINNLLGYWGIGIVRNPYDRLVSCFAEKIRADYPDSLGINGVSNVLANYGVFKLEMTFEEFVREIVNINDIWSDPHFRSQVPFIFDRHGNQMVSHIGYFENINSEFDILREKFNIDFTTPHLLKSSRDAWESYYTEDLKELVYKRYEADFIMFKYEK